MPVIKCKNGKYRIGKGKCVFKNRRNAYRAWMGCKRAGRCLTTTKGVIYESSRSKV